MPVKVPAYLMKRTYSYYARIRVPKDLNDHFGCRSELRFSLKTNNITAAKSKARLTVGLIQWVFRKIRNGGRLAVLSDKQIDELIKKHIKELLDDDLEMRLQNPNLVPKGDRFRNEYHGEMLTFRGKTLEKLLDYDFSEVSEEMEMVLKEAGHDVPKDKAIFNKMCQALLKGHVHYYEVLAERSLGRHLFDYQKDKIVDAETEQSVPIQVTVKKDQPELVTMGELAGNYWKERIESKKNRSKDKYQTINNRILEFFKKETPVGSINYYMCRDFKEFIVDYRNPPLAPKTVNDYLDYLKAMFNFELKTTRNLDNNPAAGVRDERKTSNENKRAPFDLNDLELMFIRSKHYGHDKFRNVHEFWLPLLGLYTGARLEELCQLKAADVYEEKGIWVIDVNEWDEKQSVKTGERRKIPLHPIIIELGFHKYAQGLKDGSMLWPKLKYIRSRWSHNYSGKQFKVFKDKAGIDPKRNYKVYHSFRKTVATCLKDQLVDEVIVAELLGHKHRGITYGLYGRKHRDETILKEAIMKLDFHERLDFSHLKNSKFVAKP